MFIKNNLKIPDEPKIGRRYFHVPDYYSEYIRNSENQLEKKQKCNRKKWAKTLKEYLTEEKIH